MSSQTPCPTPEEIITGLTKEWYDLIGPEHHKDRDCHWYITTQWSYGQPQTYLVKHHGYIRDDLEIPCQTYQEALKILTDQLHQALREEKEFQSLEINKTFAALQSKKTITNLEIIKKAPKMPSNPS